VITRYCIIRQQRIICDGQLLLEGAGGTLAAFMDDAYHSLKADYPKFHKMDNLSKLGFLAAEVLLKERRLTDEYGAEHISLLLSNAHSSLDTDLRYSATMKAPMASPALFVYTLPNIVAGEICIRHKIKGENAFFISPAFDATLMESYAALILGGKQAQHATAVPPPRACIVGWIDVMGEHHDVFLYLLEENKKDSLTHSSEQLEKLYNTTLWNN
jgi:hypothetical protein